MAGIRLEFAQFGDFDSFDILRSSSPMDIAALPSPLVTGLTTMYYVDTSVVVGSSYYYRAVVWRDAISQVSDEFMIEVGFWNPQYINPKLYLNVDSATWSSGALIQWNDLSSSALNFAPSGSVTEDTDGGLTFATGNNYLANSSSAAKLLLSNVGKVWVFFVVKTPTDNATIFMVNDTGATNYSPRLAIIQQSGVFTFLSSRNTFATNNFFDSTAIADRSIFNMVLLEHEWDTGRVAWHINGVADNYNNSWITDTGVTNAAQAVNDVHIGKFSTASSVNHTQECLIVKTDETLSQDDIDKLFGFAAHKYGLTDNLPTYHPYKTTVPLV